MTTLLVGNAIFSSNFAANTSMQGIFISFHTQYDGKMPKLVVQQAAKGIWNQL